jgi:hypothetical protein
MDIPWQTFTFPAPFEGFGTAVAWWAVVLGQGLGSTNAEIKGIVEDILQHFFGPCSSGGLDLAYIRYNAGAQTGAVTPGQFRPGGSVPAYFENDSAQKAVLQRIKDIKGDRPWKLEIFSNSPPQNMTISGNSAGNSTAKADNITMANLPAFCTYLLDYCQHVRNAGYNPTILSPMNEPGMTAWVAGNNQEGAYWTYSMRRALMQELRTQLALRKTQDAWFNQLILAVQEENNIADALMAETACDLSSPAIDTEYHVHTYMSAQFSENFFAKVFATPFQDSNTTRSTLASMVRSKHKAMVVSEFGLGGSMLPGDIRYPEHAHMIIERVLKDLVSLGCTRWAYWQPIENTGSNWGFTQANFTAFLQAVQGKGPFTKNDVMYGGQYYGMRELCRILPIGTTSFQYWSDDGHIAVKSAVGLLLVNKTPVQWIVKVPPGAGGTYEERTIVGGQSCVQGFAQVEQAVIVPPKAVYSLFLL